MLRNLAVILMALASPVLANAASSAGREYAQVLASKPDLEHGAELFKQCTACHGSNGAGSVAQSTPRFAGQYFRVIARQLVDFRYGYRWDFRMEEMAGIHRLSGAQDLADVAAYISDMVRPDVSEAGAGKDLERGAALYQGHCASCHGANAEGNAKDDVPRLGGQVSAYLLRQIYNTVDGRRPTMSRNHTQRLAAIDFEDLTALTDYLASIGWNTEVAAPEVPRFPIQK